MGPSRLGIMAGVVLGLMMFFVFVSLRVSAPEMELLYKDLSSTDAGAVAAKLEEMDIDYQVAGDGTRILAAKDQIGRARMLLAEAGLPNGGSLGYELFDEQSGFGTTNFVQNINQVRALEGELARTITSLASIRSARIHLVLPQRELFSRESRPSSASVFLGVRPGAHLEKEQIFAIQSLVASAVPDLKPSKVSVIDNEGNLLARGTDDDVNLMSLKAEELRRAYESRMTQKLEGQIGRIVGFGNIRATVTAEMNFDRISTNEEIFDPEQQIVRSSQISEENSLEREPIADDVSLENNLPGIAGDILADQKPTSENNRVEEVTNYEIGRTVRNTVREVGEIKRIAVAILVDGIYTTDEEGTRSYAPRPQEELDQITKLVKSAVGFDEGRGDIVEVVNLQFAEIDTDEEISDERMLFGFDKGDLLDAAEILTVAVMIILVVMLVLQPMVARMMEASRPPEADEALEADLLAGQPAAAALTGPSDDDFDSGEEEESMISLQGIEGKVKASSLKKIEEIVENYPVEAVSVLRSWMTQES